MYRGSVNEHKLEQNGVICHRYGCSNRLDLVSGFSLAVNVYKLAKRHHIDVFSNVWRWYDVFFLYLGAKLAGKKLLVRVAGSLSPFQLPDSKTKLLTKYVKQKVKRALCGFSFFIADHIHVISSTLCDELLATGVERRKLSVVPPGMNMDGFSPAESGALPAESIKLLFVGRIEKTKGVDMAVEAALEARKVFPNLQLVLIGDGNRLEELRSKYRAQDSFIVFKGYVPNESLNTYYRSADALIVPSRNEAHGLNILEAFACRTPVIGNRVGEIKKHLADNRGILVDFENTCEVVEAVRRYIEDVDFRGKCVDNALKYVIQYHSFDAVREQYLEMFGKVTA